MATKLRAILKGQKGAITRVWGKFEEISATATDCDDLHNIEETLRTKLHTIKDIHEQIIDAMPSEDAGEIEAEVLQQEDYVYELQGRLQKVISYRKVTLSNLNANSQVFSTANPHVSGGDTSITQTDQTAPPQIPIPSHSATLHRLPKLDLPRFDGDILEWPSFWDSYESAIHSNVSLSNVQKFNYLKCCLQNEARQTIAGFLMTNANYDKAVSLLHERFGHKDRIIQRYMTALMEVPSPAYTVTSLREFYNSTETYIRALDAMDQSVSTYGSLLSPVILQKLPVELRQNMARAHGTQSWQLTELMAAMMSEINVLDVGSTLSAPRTTTTATFFTKSDSRKDKEDFPTEHKKSAVKRECVFCKGRHFTIDCRKVDDTKKRLEIVKKAQLCFNCLGNHKISDCKSRYSCRKCSKRHHTSLCTEPARVYTNTSFSTESLQESKSVLHSAHSIPTGPVILKTAVSTVSSGDTSCKANILFDEGSQSSFITEKMAKRLKLTSTGKEAIGLSGFGDSKRRLRHLETAVLYLQTGSEEIPMKVLIVPEISVPLKSYRNKVSKLTYLKGLTLAHPVTESESFDIEILVGANYYWSVVLEQVIRGDGPTAIQSKLGYLLSGPLSHTTRSHQPIPVNMMNVITMHTAEEADIERFWKVEAMGVEPVTEIKNHSQYLKNYQDSCISNDKGKYVAKLPWKEEHETLPTNEVISHRRTMNVVNRLKKEPKLLQTYGNIIKEQEERGFIERVPDAELQTAQKVHYIPHHAVRKDSSTTPLRIVYDCSCKAARDAPSLNDCLMSTPPQLNDLPGILLQFRSNKYAIATDIEKAFLNVRLHEDDRDVTRFFWLSDSSDPYSKLQAYRFKSVLFGATCSPFILDAVILKHLEVNPGDTTDLIRKGLYVDNILTSVPDEASMTKFFFESRDIFQQASFNLRSWSSNCTNLRAKFQSEDIADNDEVTKVLGMRWDTVADELTFPQNTLTCTINSLLTKREVLKESSSIFDPLGLLSPVTVKSKMLLQSLWKQTLDWDEVLPAEIITEWSIIRSDIRKACETKVNRFYFSGNSSHKDKHLHVFSDASSKAYGACAYLVSGNISTLVMAKNKVAPIKQLTIPKLELCAALMGARLSNYITEHLECNDVTLWSDSQIVLQWISSSKKQPVFVENRVQEIRNLTNCHKWRYCPTDTNPADLLSRGMTYEKFKVSTLWITGPDWLKDEKAYPPYMLNNSEQVSVTENSTLLLNNKTDDNSSTPGMLHIIDVHKFSSYHKLLRVCAYVLRFVSICRKRNSATGHLEAQEIDNAAKLLIRHTQTVEYSDIAHFFDSEKEGHKVSAPNLVRQLDLFMDTDSIIRCRGRISNAPVPQYTKHPYLLPTKGKLTELIISNAHRIALHSGVEGTTAIVRQRFWIPAIRQRVRATIRMCVTCRKVTGKPFRTPDPPPLPRDRLRQEPPFTVTGVDFTGALNVRAKNGQIQKVYICLFTCANTRAVHLEIVDDMTTETFILATRRFFSRKGMPKVIMSDNALTFIATAKIVRDELLNPHGITWKFIPQHAPWYGGWWERMIGVTKNCVKKVLGKTLVGLDVLQTVITEVECIINDRPLTHQSAHPADDEPLTPAHLLYGRRITSLVYPDEALPRDGIVMNHDSTNKLFRFKCAVIEHFWSRWKHEYLTSLREFHKHSGRNGDQIRIGEVVQIHDNSTPRGRWALGVIDDVITGGDGRIRAARVRCKREITTRPIAKLYPLEICN